MKNKMSRILSVVLSVLMLISVMPLSVSAEATADGFTYAVTDGEAEITGYEGSLTELVIPDEIDGYPVTAIGNSAFWGNTALTSVIIPDSVTDIRYSAFFDCTNLSNIVIPGSVITIGDNVFQNCYAFTDITIPDSVTDIGECAFWNCKNLVKITIPASVETIGECAFGACGSLTTIIADEDSNSYCVDEYGVLFNKDKTELIQYPTGSDREAYDIPDSVISIGKDAFSWCNSLKSVTVPDSVKHIGTYAFRCSPQLINISIPDSVETIGQAAFFSNAYYHNEDNWYDGGLYINKYLVDADFNKLTNGTIEIKPDTVLIADYTFWNCETLTSVVIPDSVISIGESAFNYCENLSEITIGNSVESIGAFAFGGCYALTNIVIPDSVTSIGDYAFHICNNLSDIVIGNSVESIGADAFYNCSALTDIVIPDSVISIGDSAFDLCENLSEVTIGNSVESIGNSAFDGCVALTDIAIPDSVTRIGSYAFSGCKNLSEVTIGNSLECIEKCVFENCGKLSAINIPESVTSIGYCAFRSCRSLADIVIPENVESIGSEAFTFTGIKKLEIPASTHTIEIMPCYGGMLEEYIVDEENQYYCSDEYGVLYTKDKTELISYPSHSQHTVYAIADGTERILEGAFSYQYTLKELTMPDSVKAIDTTGFAMCMSLEKMRVSENLESIGESGFYYCLSLKELVLPASLKAVGEFCFVEMYSLEGIKIYSRDVSLGESYLGYHSMGKTAEEHAELSGLFKEFLYASLCLDDSSLSTDIYLKIDEYGYNENPFSNSYPVYCYKNSTAEKYAMDYGLECIYLCEHEATALPAVPPTCTEPGLTEGSYCSECGEVFTAQEVIPAKGHSMGEWVVNGNVKTRTCSVCSTKETVIETNDGSVEIEAPENPDHNFEVDEIIKGGDSFVLVEEIVNEASDTETEVLKVFDINLKNHDGVHVQPDGSVKVKLPLDWEKNGNYKVYRVNDDGTLTDMNAYRQGSHMVFDTDHFSIYVIVEETPATDEPSEEEPSTEEKPQSCKKDVFLFFIRLIRELERFFMSILEILGFCK